MTTREAAQQIIDAVQAGKLGKLTCQERLDTMEAKAHSGGTIAPFTTPAELLVACTLIRTFLATYHEPVTQADRDMARYNTMVQR